MPPSAGTSRLVGVSVTIGGPTMNTGEMVYREFAESRA